jgi:hypothetical protein
VRVVAKRSYIVAFPSLSHCEEVEASNPVGALREARVPGFLDRRVEELLGSITAEELFGASPFGDGQRGITEAYVIDPTGEEATERFELVATWRRDRG